MSNPVLHRRVETAVRSSDSLGFNSSVFSRSHDQRIPVITAFMARSRKPESHGDVTQVYRKPGLAGILQVLTGQTLQGCGCGTGKVCGGGLRKCKPNLLQFLPSLSHVVGSPSLL